MWRAKSLEKTLMLAGGEGDNRGWDGWMVSPTRWTWVWASSGRWWRTGKPGVLQSMGLLRVGHDWATELNWTEQLYLKRRISFLCVYRKEIKVCVNTYDNFSYVNINTKVCIYTFTYEYAYTLGIWFSFASSLRRYWKSLVQYGLKIILCSFWDLFLL